MPGLDFLFGREGQFKQAPSQFDPQQQAGFQNVLQQGLQGLGTGAIEEQARRGFRQNTIPLLSERFANVGPRGLSGIGSSGYQNALQGAGTQLETNLAALRQGNAMNLLNLGLTPYQGEQYFEPGTEGIAGDLATLAARAGLAYGTGGLSEAGFGIMDLFKNLFGEKKAEEIAGQTLRSSPGRQPERPSFTSKAGTTYSGFDKPQLEGLLSRQGTIGPSTGNLGAPIEASPYDVNKFNRPLSGTYGLASGPQSIVAALGQYLAPAGKSVRGLFGI